MSLGQWKKLKIFFLYFWSRDCHYQSRSLTTSTFNIHRNLIQLYVNYRWTIVSFYNLLRPCETQISIFFKSTFKHFFGKRRTSSTPYMLILYSVFFLNDSIGIFMRYPSLKIMSVFHITLNFTETTGKYLNFLNSINCCWTTDQRQTNYFIFNIYRILMKLLIYYW